MPGAADGRGPGSLGEGSRSLATNTGIASASAANRSSRLRPALAGGFCSEISNLTTSPNIKGNKKTAPGAGAADGKSVREPGPLGRPPASERRRALRRVLREPGAHRGARIPAGEVAEHARHPPYPEGPLSLLRACQPLHRRLDVGVDVGGPEVLEQPAAAQVPRDQARRPGHAHGDPPPLQVLHDLVEGTCPGEIDVRDPRRVEHEGPHRLGRLVDELADPVDYVLGVPE